MSKPGRTRRAATGRGGGRGLDGDAAPARLADLLPSATLDLTDQSVVIWLPTVAKTVQEWGDRHLTVSDPACRGASSKRRQKTDPSERVILTVNLSSRLDEAPRCRKRG